MLWKTVFVWCFVVFVVITTSLDFLLRKLELCLTCQTSKVDVLLGSETLGGVKSFPVDQKYGANFTEQFTKILQLVVSKQ